MHLRSSSGVVSGTFRKTYQGFFRSGMLTLKSSSFSWTCCLMDGALHLPDLLQAFRCSAAWFFLPVTFMFCLITFSHSLAPSIFSQPTRIVWETGLRMGCWSVGYRGMMWVSKCFRICWRTARGRGLRRALQFMFNFVNGANSNNGFFFAGWWCCLLMQELCRGWFWCHPSGNVKKGN